ncbi:hypothetical protein V2J09_003315 [Rumex salicifolius]
MDPPSPTPTFVPDSQPPPTPMDTTAPETTAPGHAAKLWKDVAVVAEESRLVLDHEFLKGKIVISFPKGSDADPIISVVKDVIEALSVPWTSSSSCESA